VINFAYHGRDKSQKTVTGTLEAASAANVAVPGSGVVTYNMVAKTYASSSSTPTIAITATPASPLSGTVTLSGTYTGATPSGINITIGSGTALRYFAGTVTGAGTWSASIDTTQIANGSGLELVVFAMSDASHAQAVTAPISVTVSNAVTATATFTYQTATLDPSQITVSATKPLLVDLYLLTGTTRATSIQAACR